MHKMYELRDMLMEELEKCTDKGELSAGSLDIVDKLTHSIKSIDTILAMEDAGYSRDDGYSYGYTYARGRRNARRDSMGRYSRRGYSRDKEELVEELRGLEMSMQDEDAKRMLHKFIKQAESES